MEGRGKQLGWHWINADYLRCAKGIVAVEREYPAFLEVLVCPKGLGIVLVYVGEVSEGLTRE